MTKHSPFRYFKTSPEIIRLAVMFHVRFPLLLRNRLFVPKRMDDLNVSAEDLRKAVVGFNWISALVIDVLHDILAHIVSQLPGVASEPTS